MAVHAQSLFSKLGWILASGILISSSWAQDPPALKACPPAKAAVSGLLGTADPQTCQEPTVLGALGKWVSAGLPRVHVDWKKPSPVKTELTLQVVVHPLLARKPGAAQTPFQKQVWKSLSELNAEQVRVVPWQSYPDKEMVVPALEKGKWNFSKLDPVLSDANDALGAHPMTLDVSTLPAWLFDDLPDYRDPKDPSQKKVWPWYGGDGHHLRDPSLKELVDYHDALVGHFARGESAGAGDTDPHTWRIGTYEFLNEPNWEHKFTKEEYTRMYDAVVLRLQSKDPNRRDPINRMHYMGASHGKPSDDPEFMEYFLNPANHAAGVPVDHISYHFYAHAYRDQPASEIPKTLFEESDRFLHTVDQVEGYKKKFYPTPDGRMAPQTSINELGTLLKDSKRTDKDVGELPKNYWNVSAAVQSHLMLQLVERGIDMVGASQLVADPGEFPSVALTDYRTGLPNARLRSLKLLMDAFKPGDQWFPAHSPSPDLSALAIQSKDGRRRLILVNHTEKPLDLEVPCAKGARQRMVDLESQDSPPSDQTLATDSVRLGGFGVSVLEQARD